MQCENCSLGHDGSYGSGRFCSTECARGFATKLKRQDISKRISKSLTGKKYPNRKIHRGYKWSKLNPRKKTPEQLLINNPELTARLPGPRLRECLIEMGREYRCESCGMDPEWQGKPLTLHVDHISGDWHDNSPKNVRFSCPNCHSQYPTSGFKGKKHTQKTREHISKTLLKRSVQINGGVVQRQDRGL